MDFSRELSLLEVGAGLGVVALCLIVESDHPQGSLGGRRRYAPMHARMSTLEGSPDEMDEGLRDVKEHVLPLLRQQEGFKGFIALGNRQSGELIGITFWESEQAMQASEEVGDRTRSDTAEDTGDTIEDVERYEVGLFEMSD
jgi:heme-degrading monooxygenase HmoA